jgi:ABC-type lipoprotein release transport system permease subunit
MLQVIPLLIGEHNPFSPDWVSFGFNATLAVVVVLLAAAWPAWRAGRVEVLEALRYE